MPSLLDTNTPEQQLMTAQLRTEWVKQQPFFLVRAQMLIDYDKPLKERWLAKYHSVEANGATPDEAARRFNEIWRIGKYES